MELVTEGINLLSSKDSHQVRSKMLHKWKYSRVGEETVSEEILLFFWLTKKIFG